MVDTGLTSGVATAASLGLSIVYLAVVAICTVLIYYRETRLHRR